MFYLLVFALLFSCSFIESCLVPNIPNGILEVVEFNETLKEGYVYNYHDPVKVKCNSGYSLYFVDASENSVFCCTDNNTCNIDTWNKPFLSCQKLCESSDLMDYTGFPVNCKSANGSTIHCAHLFEPGSKAQVQCKDRYEDVGKPKEFNCLSTGKWNQPMYRCKAICGLQTPQATQFIIAGMAANITEAPWNVAVYKPNEKNMGKMDLICGATILTERVVISAAHCFYKEFLGNLTRGNLGSFKIVAGKNLREFNENSTLEVQYFGVADIVKDVNYQGQTGKNKGDLAFVLLDKLIKFQIHIAPICLKPEHGTYTDWFLERNQTGTVFGWGYTRAGGDPSNYLKSLVVPYVPLSQCKSEASSTFIAFILDDKLCFGYKTRFGSGVCQGDSGAGLVISEDVGKQKVFYLRGIVSLGPSDDSGCDVNFYALYTNIQTYIGVIYKFLLEHPSTINAVNDLNDQNLRNKLITTTTERNPMYSNGGAPCVVPKTPNGHVTFGVDTENYNATLLPGQLHYDFEPVHLICDSESLPGNTDDVVLNFYFCSDGFWDRKFAKCPSVQQ